VGFFDALTKPFRPDESLSDYDTMMKDFTTWWDQTPEGLEDIMSNIAHHESKGKNVYQDEGGPGAGLFQYERGKDRGGITARNRLARWYEEKGSTAPNWLNQENMAQEGFDASLLDAQQQKMLFLADKRYGKNEGLYPDVVSNLGDWWARNHWAGGEKGSDIYNTRVESFNRDYNERNMVKDVTTEKGSEAY
jgi:hypothetical protein